MAHLIGSPVRLVQNQVKPGSIKASVFSLIVICLGAGTITVPYVFYENGPLLGTVFILVFGAISLYTGFLIAYCAEMTNSDCYEKIAFSLYGQRGLVITSCCNIICNVGFLISYVVLVSLIH